MMNVQTEQQEVEKHLFDELNKFSDRFPSIINLIFIIAGFSITILTFSLDKNHDTIQNFVNATDIYFCFGFLVVAFLVSVLIMIATTSVRQIVKKDYVVTFRDIDEQKENNLKLFTLVEAQKNFYILIIALISLSIPALFNYFAKNQFLSSSLPVTYVTMIIFCIAFGIYYLNKYHN